MRSAIVSLLVAGSAFLVSVHADKTPRTLIDCGHGDTNKCLYSFTIADGMCVKSLDDGAESCDSTTNFDVGDEGKGMPFTLWQKGSDEMYNVRPTAHISPRSPSSVRDESCTPEPAHSEGTLTMDERTVCDRGVKAWTEVQGQVLARRGDRGSGRGCFAL